MSKVMDRLQTHIDAAKAWPGVSPEEARRAVRMIEVYYLLGAATAASEALDLSPKGLLAYAEELMRAVQVTGDAWARDCVISP